MDFDAYRTQSLENWGQMARGWEDRHDWLIQISGPVNDWLIERAYPQPGQTVLDIAAGTGHLGFMAADRVGPGGRVLSTDFSPVMVEAARRFAQARGLTNVDHRVLDAERMDLPDDSMDVVVCRWGYMAMADPAAALAETRRVLRESGRLSFSVWSPPDRNPWSALPAMTLIQRGHLAPPEPGAPGPFAMAEQDRIRSLVNGAGFADPEIEEIRFEFVNRDFDDVWNTLVNLSGLMGRVLGALPDDERDATRAAIAENMTPLRRDDGSYVAPASNWGVLTS